MTGWVIRGWLSRGVVVFNSAELNPEGEMRVRTTNYHLLEEKKCIMACILYSCLSSRAYCLSSSSASYFLHFSFSPASSFCIFSSSADSNILLHSFSSKIHRTILRTYFCHYCGYIISDVASFPLPSCLYLLLLENIHSNSLTVHTGPSLSMGMLGS